MGTNKEDKRVSKRYSIKGCMVQFKQDSLLGRLAAPSKKHMVLDISQTGCQFIAREVFKEDSILILDIIAPYLKDKVITTKAKVAWVRISKELNVCGVGVEFVEMSDEDKQKLKEVFDNYTEEKARSQDKTIIAKPDQQ
jgi:c-di-GMP-binding flagellar brake protein YcgR